MDVEIKDALLCAEVEIIWQQILSHYKMYNTLHH